MGPFIAPGPQPEFVAYFFRVVVFEAANRMAAPANHQIRPHLQFQHPRVAQDVKYGVGNARRRIQIKSAALNDFVRDEHHIAQHGEQMILETADHHPVDERGRRRILDLELDAPSLAHDAQLEIAVLFEYDPCIVDIAAGIQDRQRALAKQRVQAALTGIQQFGDLLLGEVLQAAFGGHPRIDHVRR
jgi:hypothetical protein